MPRRSHLRHSAEHPGLNRRPHRLKQALLSTPPPRDANLPPAREPHHHHHQQQQTGSKKEIAYTEARSGMDSRSPALPGCRVGARWPVAAPAGRRRARSIERARPSRVVCWGSRKSGVRANGWWWVFPRKWLRRGGAGAGRGTRNEIENLPVEGNKSGRRLVNPSYEWSDLRPSDGRRDSRHAQRIEKRIFHSGGTREGESPRALYFRLVHTRPMLSLRVPRAELDGNGPAESVVGRGRNEDVGSVLSEAY
jgi:hypothetical protein